MFDDHLVRQQAFPDYKNIDFTWSLSCIFFTTHDFGQKLQISSLFGLDKMGVEVVFDDCPRLQILYFT